MKRVFKALKPSTAKANSQPAAAARKPDAKQPDAQDLDRAAQQKAAPDGSKGAGSKGAEQAPDKKKEVGGPDGPEPTRYGDWERGGICYDF